MRAALSTSLAVTLFLGQGVASGHEYWLDAVEPSINTDEKIIVDVRNGEKFSGAAFPYNPDDFVSIEISHNGKTEPYSARLGDYPAIHKAVSSPGIYAVSVNSSANLLEYQSRDKFSDFLRYHRLGLISENKISRARPNASIKEQYWRNAKTLIQVKDSANQSNLSIFENGQATANSVFARTGADFEMVLLDNPYTDIKEIRIQLFLEDEPLGNRQTEMFWRGDQVFRFTQQTNAEGIATFKLFADGSYMFNAVNIRAPQKEVGFDWVSRWTSITFERQGFGKP